MGGVREEICQEAHAGVLDGALQTTALNSRGFSDPIEAPRWPFPQRISKETH